MQTLPAAALFLFLLAVPFSDATLRAQSEARHEFIEKDGKRIEYFWTVPDGDGPWPALLYVHGHQIGERPGARVYLGDEGILQRRAATGFVAAAVSQPGYGESDGPPDFSGPRSQAAVRRVLEELRRNPLVRPDRIVLYGYSRGAIVSSMVAAREPWLAGVILGGGAYDLEAALSRLPEAPPDRESVKGNFRHEAGWTEEAFRQRSILVSGLQIKVPTLILHGEKDYLTPPETALRLAERLRAWGTPVTCIIFPGVPHGIPRDQRKPHVEEFLKTHALSKPE